MRARADKDHVARQVWELWLALQSSTDDGWRKMAGTVTHSGQTTGAVLAWPSARLITKISTGEIVLKEATNQGNLPAVSLKVMPTHLDTFGFINGSFICTGSFSG